MGAGGVSGELREHSEHVDAILRTHFNVANGQSASFTQSFSNRTSQPSTSSLNFPVNDIEEMTCFSCNTNFTIFKRKVITLSLRFGEFKVTYFREKMRWYDPYDLSQTNNAVFHRVHTLWRISSCQSRCWLENSYSNSILFYVFNLIMRPVKNDKLIPIF